MPTALDARSEAYKTCSTPTMGRQVQSSRSPTSSPRPGARHSNLTCWGEGPDMSFLDVTDAFAPWLASTCTILAGRPVVLPPIFSPPKRQSRRGWGPLPRGAAHDHAGGESGRNRELSRTPTCFAWDYGLNPLRSRDPGPALPQQWTSGFRADPAGAPRRDLSAGGAAARRYDLPEGGLVTISLLGATSVRPAT